MKKKIKRKIVQFVNEQFALLFRFSHPFNSFPPLFFPPFLPAFFFFFFCITLSRTFSTKLKYSSNRRHSSLVADHKGID